MLERQMDLVIRLLETLPERMCVEMEKKNIYKRYLREELREEIEFYSKHIYEINRFKQGLAEGKTECCTCSKMDCDSGPVKSLEVPKKNEKRNESPRKTSKMS